jgi:hypothetical protein
MAQSALKLKETGQSTMFDLFGEEVATPLSSLTLESAPVPKQEILAWEKEMLGIWLSEHPFTHAAPQLAPLVTALCNEITPENMSDLPAAGRDFVMAGIVGSTRRLSTRDGRTFIAADVQDLSGNYEVTVWPDVYERTQDYWVAGSIVLMQVRVRERGDRLSAGVQEVTRFDENFSPPFWLSAIPDAPRRPVAAKAGGNGGTNGNGHTEPASAARVENAVPPPPDDDDAFRFSEDDMLLPGELPPEDDIPSADTELVENERRGAYAAEPVAAADPEDEPVVPQPPFEPSLPSAPVAPTRAALASPVAPSERAPDVLRLVLQESEDESDDQKRLGMVFRLLNEQPGIDKVLLTIRTREGEAIDLALPTARLDESLRSRLREAVGNGLPVPSR